MQKAVFEGFPAECVKYYRGLKRHNDKIWFDNHRAEYDEDVIDPARRFVGAMGARLKRLAPGIQADPRVNRSIFRIYRDVRFSSDKTPYKTHLGIWFWDGSGKRMDCSGFYFHLEPPRLGVYAGVYIFPKQMIAEYRNSVVDPKHGPALRRAVKKCLELPGCSIGGKHYKRVPRGFDPDHRNAEYLLHNGFGVGVEEAIPEELHTPEIIDWCYERYKAMAPVHRWLQGVIERAAASG